MHSSRMRTGRSSLFRRGVPGPGGGSARYTSPPGPDQVHPPLLTESQTPVKTLPWPNFVAAGNEADKCRRFEYTARQRICGKVMFSVLSVRLFRGDPYRGPQPPQPPPPPLWRPGPGPGPNPRFPVHSVQGIPGHVNICSL